MKCQFCSNPASVHLTDIIDKKKHEMHLCESCARSKKLLLDPPSELNIPVLLHLVLSELAGSRPGAEDPVCPNCGIPYAQVRSQGRLGCPHDYEAFEALLRPLLRKVHAGATAYRGKIPKRHQRRLTEAQRRELEARLALAVAAERYEDAAVLRDELRRLETHDES